MTTEERTIFRYMSSNALDHCFRCGSGWVRINQIGEFVCDKCDYVIDTVYSTIVKRDLMDALREACE